MEGEQEKPPNGGELPAEALAPVASHTTTDDLTLDVVDPVELRIENLSVSIDAEPPPWYHQFLPKKVTQSQTARKAILNGVDASIPSGSLTVILGGSGR